MKIVAIYFGKRNTVLQYNIKKNILLLLFILGFFPFYAATIVSAGSGNWNDASTWIGACVPLSTDNVLIANDNVVLIDGKVSCVDLTIGNTSLSPTLKIVSANGVLTSTGLLTMNAENEYGSYTLDAGAGIVHINGALAWASSAGQNIIETTAGGTVIVDPCVFFSQVSQKIKVTSAGGVIKFNAAVFDQHNGISVASGGAVYFADAYIVNSIVASSWNKGATAYFSGAENTIKVGSGITFGNVVLMNNALRSVPASDGIFNILGSLSLSPGSVFALYQSVVVKQHFENRGGTVLGANRLICNMQENTDFLRRLSQVIYW